MGKVFQIVLLVGLTAGGAWLLSRGLNGGGPAYFFLSAVLIGLAIGVVQSMRRKGG